MSEQIDLIEAVQVKYCSQSTWFLALAKKDMSSSFKDIIRKYGYCIDAPAIDVYGKIGSAKFSQFRIDVLPCEKTAGATCDTTLNREQTEIAFGYFDYSVNTEDFSNPWNYYYHLLSNFRIN